MFERLSGVGEEPAAVFVTLCHILLHFIITLFTHSLYILLDVVAISMCHNFGLSAVLKESGGLKICHVLKSNLHLYLNKFAS